MKKRMKHILGVALAGILLCADIQWPAPKTAAAQEWSEGAGRESEAQKSDYGLDMLPSGAGTQEGGAVSETGQPGAGAGTQESGTAPGMGQPGAGAATQESGTASGTGQPEAGAGTQESGAVSGTGQPGAGAGTQESGTASGTGQPGAGAGTQESGTASGTGQPEAGAGTQEGGTASETGQPEAGADSQESAGAAGTGQQGDAGAGNTYGAGRRTSENADEETAEWIRLAGEALTELAAERDILATVYLSDEYPIRREPSYDSEAAVTVLSGQTVNILDIYVDEEPQVWEYVRLDYEGREIYGYVPRTYLACADSRFLAWEEQYGLNLDAETYVVDENGNKVYSDIQQFPESYRPALLELKKKHPNWTFAKLNTTLDWETTIRNELKDGKSLVYYTFPDWAKEGPYDEGTWYYASEAVLKQQMDPRNGLTEKGIFQFEQLTFNKEYHTEAAVKAFLNNTFMHDGQVAPGTDMTYATIFWAIAKEEGREVSPFHLVARVIQEQGHQGTSPMISGTCKGYEGYYNYFNVGATGKTQAEVLKTGLEYAKKHGWKGAYYSILGGADFISANYIKKGQDTLYLQKFNVNPNGTYPVYTHQYMQNISAPSSEGANIKKLYETAGALENSFVFKIPVYENMPPEACGEPKVSTNVVVTPPKGYSDTTLWLDGVAYTGELRNGNLIVTAPDGKAKTAVLYKYDGSGIPTGMYLWSLSYNGTAYTATPETGLEDLLTYHGFSIRITGKSGLRFKTGISASLRAALTAAGVNGYRLKEYGTLIMNDANRAQYPMIKGGQKIVESLAYGLDSSGRLQDVIFETVAGRHRYTSVLVGIPASQYKTQYAFRGYAVLEKNGTQVIVYGPVVVRNIYGLAKQLIEKGSYEPGTDAYAFLQKLISDADAFDKPTVSSGNAAR